MKGIFHTFSHRFRDRLYLFRSLSLSHTLGAGFPRETDRVSVSRHPRRSSDIFPRLVADIIRKESSFRILSSSTQGRRCRGHRGGRCPPEARRSLHSPAFPTVELPDSFAWSMSDSKNFNRSHSWALIQCLFRQSGKDVSVPVSVPPSSSPDERRGDGQRRRGFAADRVLGRPPAYRLCSRRRLGDLQDELNTLSRGRVGRDGQAHRRRGPGGVRGRRRPEGIANRIEDRYGDLVDRISLSPIPHRPERWGAVSTTSGRVARPRQPRLGTIGFPGGPLFATPSADRTHTSPGGATTHGRSRTPLSRCRRGAWVLWACPPWRDGPAASIMC